MRYAPYGCLLEVTHGMEGQQKTPVAYWTFRPRAPWAPSAGSDAAGNASCGQSVSRNSASKVRSHFGHGTITRCHPVDCALSRLYEAAWLPITRPLRSGAGALQGVLPAPPRAYLLGGLPVKATGPRALQPVSRWHLTREGEPMKSDCRPYNGVGERRRQARG